MSLSKEEKKYIKHFEDGLDSIFNNLNEVKKFNLGDYVVAFEPSRIWGDDKFSPVINSYGAPKKFQVIYVDRHGIPYLKELNKLGNPVGQIIRPISWHYLSETISVHMPIKFEIDPDYTDALIFDDQENFNPSKTIKLRAETYKDIAKYNKSIRIKSNDGKVITAFLSTIKVGDILWRSNSFSWSVIEMNPIPRDKGGRLEYHSYFMKVSTNNGTIRELCLNDFRSKSIYTARPRTYKELSDLK